MSREFFEEVIAYGYGLPVLPLFDQQRGEPQPGDVRGILGPIGKGPEFRFRQVLVDDLADPVPVSRSVAIVLRGLGKRDELPYCGQKVLFGRIGGGEDLRDTPELRRIGDLASVLEVRDGEVIFLDLKVAQAEFISRLNDERRGRELLDDLLVITERLGVVSLRQAHLSQTIERPVPVCALREAGEKNLYCLRGLVVLFFGKQGVGLVQEIAGVFFPRRFRSQFWRATRGDQHRQDDKQVTGRALMWSEYAGTACVISLFLPLPRLKSLWSWPSGSRLGVYVCVSILFVFHAWGGSPLNENMYSKPAHYNEDGPICQYVPEDRRRRDSRGIRLRSFQSVFRPLFPFFS